MSVSKLSTTFIGSIFAGAMMATSFAVPAYADTTIKNASDCQFEGGSMTQIKGSDYCLVAIRPAEYADAAYDGNQLGIVDCPGDKLNEGVFCMYPVTILPSTVKASESVSHPAMDAVEPAAESEPKKKKKKK